MRGVKDVPADAFIKAYAEHLAEKLPLPDWVDIVKTGCFKELPPDNDNWYHVRAASICRKLYFRPEIGVGRFRTFYGGKTKRTIKAGHHRKSSGGLIRHILQQLEKIGFVEQSDNALKGGRKLTPRGQRDMDLVAFGIHFDSYLDEMIIPPDAAGQPVFEGEVMEVEPVDA
eukprot:g5241.t1